MPQPLIDPMSIVYSNARAKKVTDSGSQQAVIRAFKSLLPAVGWSVTGNGKAVASVQFPFGAPQSAGGTSPTIRPAGCQATPFFSLGGATFSLYDPASESPAPGAQCTMVAMGTTGGGTLDALASAITSGTPWNATVAVDGSGFRLDVEAKNAGPDFNLVHVQGDGRWGTIATNGGNTVGGGYTFRSKADPESAQYEVSITGIVSVFGNISLEFNFNGNLVQYILTESGGSYTILANGFGFFIFLPGDDGSYPFVNHSLFCMAPKMPGAEQFASSTYAVFICGPRTFRDATYWFGRSGLITTVLDSGPNTYSNTGGWPRILALRSPGPALHTPANKPVITAAYVCFGQGPSSTAYVIGKLWDCAVVSDLIAAGATINGQPFITVSSQNGASGATASSLVMFGPPQVTDPPPPADPPIYPKTQPSTSSGTCIIPSVGFVVLALTGSFAALHHLSPITIDGIPFLVDAVQDATHLSVTEVASARTRPVAWTSP